MLKKGKFIVVEGLEGAGKTTAIDVVKSFLAIHSIDVVTTREPGGTSVGERLRDIVKSQENIDPYTELLLFYAARTQLLKEVVWPALSSGVWVLADRFELSTFAYQGGGRQLDLSVIKTLSDLFVNVQPDLTLFLDISPKQGLERALVRGQLDRIEQESLSFFERVYKEYHRQIHARPNTLVIDASKPLSEVQQNIVTILDRLHHAVA